MSIPEMGDRRATPETGGRNWFKIILWVVGGCGCILPLLALGALLLLSYILHPNSKPYKPRVPVTPTALPVPRPLPRPRDIPIPRPRQF